MARLMWTGLGKKKHWKPRRSTDTHVSVICVYASTAKAPPGNKQKFFFVDLQDTLDKIPHNDILVMLGDLNARVSVLDEGST